MASGTFAGKMAFGSVGPQVYYLTRKEFKSGVKPAEVSEGSGAQILPVMAARAVTEMERWTFYQAADQALRIQSWPGRNETAGLWIGLNDLEWLVLADSFQKAAPVRLSGNPVGQVMEVLSRGAWRRVYYTAGGPSPILTLNGEDPPPTFAPRAITPSLEAIRKAGKATSADFQHVDFSGEDLSGIDFTGADFLEGNLRGAKLNRAVLTDAKLHNATLTSIEFNGATLDRAVMTGVNLDSTAWGKPASAVGLNLTDCHARGATLGDATNLLDCTGATLASGDFQGADLRNLQLKGAKLGGAILAGCKLDGALLDNANLAGVVATGAKFTKAIMKGVKAQGAVFVGADFGGADLARAQMGAKAWLFEIEGTYARNLDGAKFVQPDLIARFSGEGITLPPSDAVTIVVAGDRWSIVDSSGPYVLTRNADGKIDVFNSSPDLRPATFYGALCKGTKAAQASFSGADLRQVAWYTKDATLDHADLEGAMLSGSMLMQLDLTQAYLSGADLSRCVLVQASFRACRLSPGDNRRAFSLAGSLIQQADFTDASLINASAAGASVSVLRGVPLFRLAPGSEANLTPGKLLLLKPQFEKAGYPLAASPALTEPKSWLVDNSADKSPSARAKYLVRLVSTTLVVYDGLGVQLFNLDAARFEPGLASAKVSQELANAFTAQNYSLAVGAPIAFERGWQIDTPTKDPSATAAWTYPTLRIYPDPAGPGVYGAVRILLRDWTQFPGGLAFGATVGIQAALNPASIAPNGFPRSWFDNGSFDWETLMTAR